ncbi:YusW family protein [Sporosarcina aquimarina]|uniref:YusW family protein n=1 Tax=Sporosarcina aquimarina TaxID=114975 RepID=UPI00203CD50D|nr:YusW family protein [Sporosarcina aquimarina]MCM3757875.1 YusW family protein [Sporosarcina aquimarina]
MRKSASIAGSVLATALLLGACGTNDTNTEKDTTSTEDTTTDSGTVTDESNTSSGTNDSSTTNDSTASDSDQDYMKEKMDKLTYDEFELEVDYGKDKEYEIEIEQDNGTVESTVEDELSNSNLHGREAFDEIYPKLEKLEITETTSKEQAIQQALDAFNLKDDYVKFDIELTMPDGQKIQFEDKK